MSTTSVFLAKADTAITKTAVELTSLLRTNLMSGGWGLEASLSTSIFYTGERFDYKFEGPNADEAMTLEFGSEDVRPTALVRKFLNKSQLIDRVYVSKLETELGDLL